MIRLAALIALACMVAGCGLGGNRTPVPSYSCDRVPTGACGDQANLLDGAAPGQVKDIALSCVGLECTRAGGAGHATVTLADGTIYGRTWSYIGDPNPPPVPMCFGLPRSACLKRAQDLAESVSPSHHLVSVTVTCTTTCSVTTGDAMVVFLSEGGMKDAMGASW